MSQNYRMVNGLTASTTQTQAGGLALDPGSKGWRVTTVASAADAVTLPKAINGMHKVLTNAAAANAMGVFPAKGDAINALSADAVLSVAANKVIELWCFVDGTWNTNLTA